MALNVNNTSALDKIERKISQNMLTTSSRASSTLLVADGEEENGFDVLSLVNLFVVEVMLVRCIILCVASTVIMCYQRLLHYFRSYIKYSLLARFVSMSVKRLGMAKPLSEINDREFKYKFYSNIVNSNAFPK